jgi:hypothetical protein
MMTSLKDQLSKLLQDPRTARLMKDPRVQRAVVEGFRLKGRVEGALGQRLQRVAGSLSLATQRDLRALHRRIRHLERELRETEERLIEAEDTRVAPDRS